jgi:ABC-type oligopeptide transport system substrate-binding subunit/serine/threonine protein kinase
MNPVHRIANRFEIRDPGHDLLGRGGMGAVYRATDTLTGALVAVKTLDSNVVTRDPELLERFAREGEALRQLNHPNIVRMIAAVEEEGQRYLVMEYVEGGSLRDVLEKEGRLSVTRAVEIALDLADALTRAHRLGILHRDLKPENVLLARDGTPRLADFGLAHLPTGSRLTQSGILMGTIDYVSPEACDGEATDERSDIWSFGVMLFEMLAGRVPFTGDALIAKLNAILTQPVPGLGQLVPGTPGELADVVYRMLEKDPAQRIPSVRQVAAELEAVLRGWKTPTPAGMAATTPPRPTAANLPPQVAPDSRATSGRRTVTILSCDAKSWTTSAKNLDPEDLLELMNGALDLLIEAVARHEGTLARPMGDAVLAFFGAPLAREDDPERAVHAALEVVAAAQQYAARLKERGLPGFSVQVGIHTGLVVTGEVGSDQQVEYTAMGDAVDLAARIEQAAPPGGILITHDTYRHVRGVFDVQVQPPLAVQGKGEPVQTYLVQRAKPRAFRKPTRGIEGIETRMVGREAELKHLQEAFCTVVEEGELQMVTVTGEAGVGKSRLLHEFDVWAELLPESFYYFRGRAGQETQNLPFGLLRDLISFRLEILDSDPTDVVGAKLEQGLLQALGLQPGLGTSSGEGTSKSAVLIGCLLGFALGERRTLASTLDDPQQLHDEALAALVRYFRGLAGQAPVLILLEDLHWADDSSLDALNSLARAVASEPVMIVCTARPALFERRPHCGEGQPFHARLALAPLSQRDSRRLVAEILQKLGEVPATLRDRLVAGAEGNPFFLEELIRMLVEDGVIATAEDRWTLKPERLAEIRVPPTLTGVLQARVDRLPAEERIVLQQASVVGRLFWDQAVTRIYASSGGGADEAAVTDRLAALRGREMIYQRETSAFAEAREYIFQHALLREVTYESVLKRLRKVYHGLVADWLLGQAGERAGEYTSLLADHLALAGRTEEAVKYLLEAGGRARGLYAHQEAIQAYERALALLTEMGDEERAARTLMKLGLTYHTAFDFQRARQAHEEGFRLWQHAASILPAKPLPLAPHALRLHWENPRTLDPGLANDVRSSTIIHQIFSGLVAETAELDVVPDVAASWEVLDGGCRYLFHLRPDVAWSDGVPVTAHDFQYAWRRVLDPATGSRAASTLYDIKGARAFHEGLGSDVGVRALDDLTLAVDLEAPTSYFLHLLAFDNAYPIPRHVVEALGTSWADPAGVVTNGPFTVAFWQPGQSLVLQKNPRYHGRAAGNVLEVKLTLFQIHEPSVLLEAYQAGLSDTLLVTEEGRELVDEVRRRYATEYVSLPRAGTYCLVFDVTRPPFDDPRVRRAFAYALDRETLMDNHWGQLLVPATGGFVPPGIPGHVSGIAPPYEPGRARELLAEAGYPAGAGFPALEMLVFPLEEQRWDPVVRQWKENLGVQVQWYSMPWAEYVNRAQTDPDLIQFVGWVGDYPDPDTFLRVGLEFISPWHEERYLNFNEQARRALDQEERMALCAQAQHILAEKVPILPLGYDRTHLLIKPWVKRYPVSALGMAFWKDVVLEPH